MNCTDVRRLLHEEPQAGRVDASIRAHLEVCSSCQQLQQELQVMQQAFAEQPLPQLPSGFEFALRGRLMTEASKHAVREDVASRRRVSRRFAVVSIAAAAALLLVSAVIFSIALEPAGSPSYHRLQLSIKSLQMHPVVEIELNLPAGVELMPEAVAVFGKVGRVGEVGEGQTFRWRSKLARGVNRLALPLKTLAGVEKLQVKVRLKVGEKTLLRHVELESGLACVHGERGVRVAWVVDSSAKEVLR
ncbi:MAG: hypothetical protein JRH20_17370 [Deltaproteobacteria bacterium]|nr:hypothetical protein [Deltaproteobacteria bacterium]